jgi:hypothetical protein
MILLSADEQAVCEAAIAARAKEFEVPALLAALRLAGYDGDGLELRSNPSLGFTASLVESVEFLRSPQRLAVVTLNRGLLSNQGALPSYFWGLFAEQRESLMYQFLWFFDDYLLRLDYEVGGPGRSRWALREPAQALADLLKLLRLASPHGLHWLFAQVFPEMDVVVRRAPAMRTLEVTRARVSRSEVGAGSALLGYSEISAGGLIVELFANEATTAQGELWGSAAERRLERLILPQLAGSQLLLTVILAVRDHHQHLELHESRHLSYGVLADSTGGRPQGQLHRIVVFHRSVDAEGH